MAFFSLKGEQKGFCRNSRTAGKFGAPARPEPQPIVPAHVKCSVTLFNGNPFLVDFLHKKQNRRTAQLFYLLPVSIGPIRVKPGD
jgi:hypothetical protein